MLIKAGAKQYKIEYDLNKICDFEELTNIDITDMTDRKLSSLGAIRALLFCGLKNHQPELSIEDAGNILNEYFKGGKTVKTLLNVIDSEMENAGFRSKDSNQHPQSREKKRNNYHSKNNVSKRTNT